MMMMTYAFANMTAYAQGSCAVSACSDMNSIILSLDAIMMASIIIFREITIIGISLLVLVLLVVLSRVAPTRCNC